MRKEILKKKNDSQKISRNESMTSAVETESPRKLRIEKTNFEQNKNISQHGTSCNQSWQ